MKGVTPVPGPIKSRSLEAASGGRRKYLGSWNITSTFSTNQPSSFSFSQSSR